MDQEADQLILALVRAGNVREAAQEIRRLGRTSTTEGFPYAYFSRNVDTLRGLSLLGIDVREKASNGSTIEQWILTYSPDQIINFHRAGFFDESVRLADDETLLFDGCRYSKPDRVETLLSVGVDPLHVSKQRGCSAMHIAAAHRNWDSLRAIFLHDSRTRWVRSTNGRIPAHVMADRFDFQNAAKLCGSEELVAEDSDGMTPLDFVVANDNVAALHVLLQDHAFSMELVVDLVEYGEQCGSTRCVELLLEERTETS